MTTLALLAALLLAQTPPGVAPLRPSTAPALVAPQAPPATGLPVPPPAATPLPAITWGNPTFYHGMSAPLIEWFPKQTHPISLLQNAGYSASLCEGDFKTSGGATLSVVCLQANLFLNVAAPAGQPVGGSQIVPGVSFAGGIAGIGVVLPLINATGAWFNGPIGVALSGTIPWSIFGL